MTYLNELDHSLVAVHPVEQLRQSGLASFAKGAIRLYQRTVSRATPPVCRYRPTCSQYGIEAIEKFGALNGARLTASRIGRCRRPNGGYDPVPQVLPWKATMQSSLEGVKTNGGVRVAAHQVAKEKLPVIGDREAQFSFENFDHGFKLMLAYPRCREFYSPEEFQQKIAEFYEHVLQIPQYTICFRVDRVSAGVINDEYVCRFQGSTSGDLLQYQIDEVVNLIISQLEGFFIVVQRGEFRPLYFEVDGQVVIQPKPEDKVLPADYRADNYWIYTSDDAAWDLYWGSYIVEDLFQLLFSASGDVIDAVASGIEGASSGIGEGSGATLEPPVDGAVDFGSDSGDVVSAGMIAANPIAGDGIDPAAGIPDGGIVDGVGDFVDGAGEVIGDAVSAVGHVAGDVAAGIGEASSGCLDGCNLDGCDLGGCDLGGCFG
jgi:hypothetical protein